MKNNEKKILLELKRMKEIMGLEIPNNFILEQPDPGAVASTILGGPIGYGAYETIKTKKDSGYFSEKKTFNIGSGTEYPFIYYYGNKDFDTLPVVDGTKIYTIKKGMTSKSFLKNVKVGTVIDDLGVEHQNQEYIEEEKTFKDKATGVQTKKKIKLCLPDKSFWDLPEHIGKVYKFITPSSSEGGGMFNIIESFNTTFAMALTQKTDTFQKFSDTGEAVFQEGKIAAINCRGGDNGWGWSRLNTPPLFVDPKTKKGYNPKDPRMLDKRSDWEVWYDHYGTWLEVGIGVAASFIGAGLAALILEVAASAVEIGTMSVAMFELLETSYGTTTALSVILQVLTEGVMMAPIITWQIYDERYADGILSAIFLFIPFLSELKGVSKFIAGKYSKEAAMTLAEKIKKEGIELLLTSGVDNPEAQLKFAKFITNLTGTELALWKRGMDILGQGEAGMQALKKDMEELIKSGGKFGKEFAEAQAKGNLDSFLGKLGQRIGKENGAKIGNDFAKFWAKNINIRTARWVLPHQFIRMGVPITIFATSFKHAFNDLRPDEVVEFENNFEKSVSEDLSYYQALSKIDPYIAQAVVNKQLELITSDPEKTRKVATDPNFLNSEEGQKIKDEATADIIEQEKDKVSAYVVNELTPQIVDITTILTGLALHRALLEKLKFKEVYFLSKDNLNNIPGKATYENDVYDITIKKENNKFNYYVNNVKITDEEIKNEMWNGLEPNIPKPLQPLQPLTPNTIPNPNGN